MVSFEEASKTLEPWRKKLQHQFWGLEEDEREQLILIGMWYGYQQAREQQKPEKMKQYMMFRGRMTLYDGMYAHSAIVEKETPYDDPEVFDRVATQPNDIEDRVAFWDAVERIRSNLRGKRDKRILDLLIQGYRVTEIAKIEHISNTYVSLVVKNHLRPAFEKEFKNNALSLFPKE